MNVYPDLFAARRAFVTLFAAQHRAARRHLGIGMGWCIGHHGELLQGLVVDERGNRHRFLITMPDPSRGSIAVLRLSEWGDVVAMPARCHKAARATRLLLDHFGYHGVGAYLYVWTNLRARLGCGSSTADVTSAIRAGYAALGRPANPQVVARLAVMAEAASDSVMFHNRALAFCHREGRVLEDFGTSYPSIDVLGFSTDAGGVDTLALPPANYDAREIDAFARLLDQARTAFATRDVRLLGNVASASARISQRHLPKPKFDHIERLADDVSACGIQVSHSGSVVGLMFAPGSDAIEDRKIEAAARAVAMGFRDVHGFTTEVK